ncbi:hypothetical protein CHUAL_005575 [Chamberlinius hualienensis]
MSMYPSLEDMKVDQMTKAQIAELHRMHAEQAPPVNSAVPSAPPPTGTLPYPVHPPATLYPILDDYMGLQLTPELVAQHISQPVAIPTPREVVPVSTGHGMIAPLSGQSVGLHRAAVSHGIREIVLCKDGKGKIGVKVKDISKGVFVVLVQKDSPAALGGLRFGDQILQVNGTNVAGYDSDQMHKLFKNCPTNNIVVAVRDRPYERTITMHKGSSGHIGFMFKNAKIISIVKESSAARNGVLIDHYLLEVNGQNVVGLKDKQITEIITEGGQTITITIMPAFIYDHMMKNIASFLVKETMDHSIKDL